MHNDAWDSVAEQFTEQYGSLFGQVRMHVLRTQLRWHLPPPPATVIDVGGGAGHQAIPLTRDGYDVTLLDSSPDMLDRARRRVGREDEGVASRLRIVEGTGEMAPDTLGGQQFEAVLCHGVLPYLDDREPMLSALVALVRNGGILSLVVKNARALAMRPAAAHDWAGALVAFDATREVNRLGLETRGDTPEGLADQLDEYGATSTAWYGVRLFTEGWARDVAPVPDDDAVLSAELEASRRDPYRQLSRLFHLIAVRSRP